MYPFILSAFFFVVSIVMILVRPLATPGTDGHLALLVLFIVFAGAGFIAMFAMTINNLVKGVEIMEKMEELKTQQNKIKLGEKKKDELMSYMEEQVLNVFPKFEERVIQSVAPGSNKDLLALFQKYPELKSSKHLAKLVDDVTQLVDGIYSDKRSMEYTKEKIRLYLVNPWFPMKVKVSEEVRGIINTEIE